MRSKPPDALKRLQAACEKTFPVCNDLSTISPSGWHGHLTLGQWENPVRGRLYAVIVRVCVR